VFELDRDTVAEGEAHDWARYRRRERLEMLSASPVISGGGELL
jgi:hypothetical protein